MPKPKLHWPTVALLVAALVGISGWLWSLGAHDRDIRFLSRHGGAHWIVGQDTVGSKDIITTELRGDFRRSFELDRVPVRAPIEVYGFERFELMVNGNVVETEPSASESHESPDWKTPRHFDVGPLLRPGNNDLSVTVVNRRGPPALWLLLTADSTTISTDTAWQVSISEGYWRAAHYATEPHTYRFDDERPRTVGKSLHDVGPIWFAMLVASALVVAATLFQIRFARWRQRSMPERSLASQPFLRSPYLPLVLGGALWCLLFWNNERSLPARIGFDAAAHKQFINYVQQNQALPLPSDGWEMFQPPLYYVSSAMLLGAGNRTVATEAGVRLLRTFNLLGGLVQITFLFLSLRILLPDQPWKQVAGWLVGTFLPAQFYIFQFISNEGWSAALSTVGLYCTLRVLDSPASQLGPRVALGVFLATAVLTKFTAVVLIGVIFIVLAGRLVIARERKIEAWLIDLGIPASLIALLAGWHFVGVWYRYGSPFIGNWDERLGFSWWQEPGYLTINYFLRFGESLRQPYFSASNSFFDALYSTLWGDGLCGGKVDFVARAPWNDALMTAGYLLALVPTVLIVFGFGATVLRLVSRPCATDFLLTGLAAGMALAIVAMVLKLPYLTQTKAFYALPITLCLTVFAARGFALVGSWSERCQPVLMTLFVFWSINSYASFWIVAPSVNVERSFACDAANAGQLAESAKHFEAGLKLDPDDVASRVGSATMNGYLALRRRDPRTAIQQFAEAQRLLPDQSDINNLLAGLLTTGPAELRDVPRAIRLAEIACQQTDGREFAYLRTLAAAYAESGAYAQAIETANQAYRQAQLAGNDSAARDILGRRDAYRALEQQAQPAVAPERSPDLSQPR